MKATLLASIAVSAVVFFASATPVNAAELLRLTGPQMDTATAGAGGLRVISAARGSQFSHSQAQGFNQRGAKLSAGLGQADACCGFGSFIKLLVRKNGFSYDKTFSGSGNRLNGLAAPSSRRMLLSPGALSSGGVSGKIEKFFMGR